MNIKVIKEDRISIAYMSNITDIVELPSGRVRIAGSKTCDECGNIEHSEYDAVTGDTIVIEVEIKKQRG